MPKLSQSAMLSRPMILALMCVVPAGCGSTSDQAPPSLFHDVHLVSGIAASNGDGTYNAVIEIPTGSTAKYQVDHESGLLFWEERDGGLRRIDYLGYPGNYGMIPRTLAVRGEDPAVGGDGDPIDILVLGEPVERGSVVRVRIVGLLRLIDDGERDDKVLAVQLDDPHELFRVANLEQLDEHYPNLRQIVELWFLNYDRHDELQTDGWVDREEAQRIVREAAAAFELEEREAE